MSSLKLTVEGEGENLKSRSNQSDLSNLTETLKMISGQFIRCQQDYDKLMTKYTNLENKHKALIKRNQELEKKCESKKNVKTKRINFNELCHSAHAENNPSWSYDTLKQVESSRGYMSTGEYVNVLDLGLKFSYKILLNRIKSITCRVETVDFIRKFYLYPGTKISKGGEIEIEIAQQKITKGYHVDIWSVLVYFVELDNEYYEQDCRNYNKPLMLACIYKFNNAVQLQKGIFCIDLCKRGGTGYSPTHYLIFSINLK